MHEIGTWLIFLVHIWERISWSKCRKVDLEINPTALAYKFFIVGSSLHLNLFVWICQDFILPSGWQSSTTMIVLSGMRLWASGGGVMKMVYIELTRLFILYVWFIILYGVNKYIFFPVCSDYNHVRTWSVTRFRGMISTQPGIDASGVFQDILHWGVRPTSLLCVREWHRSVLL